jgi:hypothetical protein
MRGLGERGEQTRWIRERERQRWFERVPLDDRGAVQRAITEVLNRLPNKEIGCKRAYEIVETLRRAGKRLNEGKQEE